MPFLPFRSFQGKFNLILASRQALEVASNRAMCRVRSAPLPLAEQSPRVALIPNFITEMLPLI